VAEPTFDCPDLDFVCLLDRLGLTVTGQQVLPDRTVLACRVREPDEFADGSCWCSRCGELGVPRDTVVRRLAHVPIGWRPTALHVTVRRYRCPGCAHCVAPGHHRGRGAAVSKQSASAAPPSGVGAGSSSRAGSGSTTSWPAPSPAAYR